MKVRLCFLVLTAAFTVNAWSQTSCSAFNTIFGPFPYTGVSGLSGHNSGNHHWVTAFGASCSYTGASRCNVTAQAYTGGSCSGCGTGTTESGSLTNPAYTHSGNFNLAQGSASATSGAGANADTEGAAAFRSCVGSCAVAIGLSGSGNGAGFTVSFPPDAIYSDKNYYKVDCTGETASGSGGLCGHCPCGWPPGQGCGSPIIIDTTGQGFHLTNPDTSCVTFDLKNDGKPGCYSWPEEGSGNAWLVYDRDGDGKIDSGAEMFGNFTPHSDGDYLPVVYQRPNPPQGFTALMYYDQEAQGGNGDLVIDARDAIWPKLKLWIDKHCLKEHASPCSAKTSELHRPEDFGIHSLSVVYSPAHNQDEFGNRFMFYAQTNPKPHEHQKPSDELNERRMYDVWLIEKQ